MSPWRDADSLHGDKPWPAAAAIVLLMPGLSVIIDVIKEIRRCPQALSVTQPLPGIIAGRRDYLM